ncbi:hypothetical protein ACFRK5_20190 [Streptomyces niveus]|uniref:hypothetical protein n=1 Tax=Streptomyces niveus TaxID=193462 RepID=UPI00367ED8B8
MVHLQHTVLAEPVPRRCRHAVRPGGGDLAEGGHLRAGAVYEVDDDAARIRVRVLEWNRRAAVRVTQTITDGAVTAEIEGVPRDVEHPRTAGLRGATRSTGTRWASLTRATGTSQLRLDDWWTAAAGTGPLTAVALRLPRLRERALDALADPPDTPEVLSSNWRRPPEGRGSRRLVCAIARRRIALVLDVLGRLRERCQRGERACQAS